jgi:predicted ATPase
VQTKGRPNLKQIGSWLNQMGLAKSVEVSRVGKSDLFDVNVTLSDDANLPIADLGYGMSQVLPVLAQCSFSPAKATLLFEQPELHLNHTAAKKLAGVFVSAAKAKDLHIIAETHSRELFLGLLDEIRAKRLKPADIAIYTVARKDGSSKFSKIGIEVDEHGNPDVYDPWDNHL